MHNYLILNTLQNKFAGCFVFFDTCKSPTKTKTMTSKTYSFETSKGYNEFYDIRVARKEAIKFAKENNTEVLVTCMYRPSFKQDWYTATPDGKWYIEVVGFRADN